MTDPALAKAVAFIAQQEGFRSEPYQDVGGTWTIGYGFTHLSDDGPVDMLTEPMTQQQALEELITLVSATMASVREMIHVPVNDNQVAALTSFAYNEGTSALRTSTLMHNLNSGAFKAAKACFASWVYSKGRVIPDLVKRRALEAEMFLPSPPDEVA